MRSLCMITVKPGKVDAVLDTLKKRKRTKEAIVVTGRADICVLLQGSINEINKTLIGVGKINDIASTETLIEVDVNLGW